MKNLINKIKNKPIVLTLSWTALVLTALSWVCIFFEYNHDAGGIKFCFPGIINLIYLVKNLSPYVLLTLYISKYHHKLKATIIIPIVFGIITISYIFNVIDSFRYDFFGGIPALIYGIFCFILSVLFALSTVASLQGFIEKRLVIITLSISLLLNGWFFIDISREAYFCLGYFETYLILIRHLSGRLANCLLYVSLLLFCLKYKIPVLISSIWKKTKDVSPEQELRALKHELELGLITNEEYQQQREEIISKL